VLHAVEGSESLGYQIVASAVLAIGQKAYAAGIAFFN
jgi:hypothetical protein